MHAPNLITLDFVETKANEFLNKYHPQLTLPVPIEDIVELELNIRIILIKSLEKIFGVNAFINRGFDSIIIDESMFIRQPERIRFTITEEVGHLFLHKEWYMNNGPKNMENHLDWQEKMDSKLFDYIERQARTFAGFVLMPKIKVLEVWKNFAEQFYLPTPCGIYNLPDTFPRLAREFFVSTESMLVRLSFLKLVILPDGFWDKIKEK